VSFLSARELELWKPIIVLAQFFQKYLSPTGSQHAQLTLPTLILNLAKRKSRERQVEEMTETSENILVQTLLDLAQSDGYYSLKQIRMAMTASFDEEQKWLTNEWVGRALKRLGFSEKRRVGPGVEYHLTQKAVENLAERMGIRAKLPITVKVKEWCKNNKDENGEIDLSKLAVFIKDELQQEPQKVIAEAFKQSILQESPSTSKAVVV